MERIASFSVNHDILEPGMYLSRIDGDCVTYDVRMKKPNGGDYLVNGAMHTIEHLFATYARNTEFSDRILYVGPMGCRTGFYLLVRDSISHAEAIRLVKESMEFIAAYEGTIPGTNKIECGNYLEHDLAGAKKEAAAIAAVLADWTPEQMTYKK
ncbi:MAG: S-ribosylhomocysteine lyase [Clostridia bacterium]|nr:S-ribosylhomocysteine lyase [Clostridia bacterium]